MEQQLLPRVHQAVGFAFRAAGEALSARPPRGHCFGLFGVDFVLDAALRPWLLEIQVNPGLKHHDPAKRQIIPPLLAETIRAAREVRDRRRSGKSLARLGGLDRFLWVVNEAGSGESS